jgi:hypothetical protein
MPRPFCFRMPYARFSPAHALRSLENAVELFPDARVERVAIDMQNPDEQHLIVDVELGPTLSSRGGDGDGLTGTLGVRFDGQTVALVVDAGQTFAVLPAVFAIAEAMLGELRDLAAVAAGADDDDDEPANVDRDPWRAPVNFDELSRRAKRLFSVDARREGAFGVTVAWQKPVLRTQGMLFQSHQPRFDEDGATWVTIESPVCPRNRLTPEEALRRSRALDIGALCLRKEHYTIVARYPLRMLDRVQFVTISMALAEEADKLEALLTGGKDAY